MIFEILIAIIVITIFIMLIKSSIKLIKKLVLNTILGLLLIFILNIFGAGIPINWITLLITILFGLPGAGTLGILALLGVI